MGGLYHTINTQILSRKPYLTPTLYNEALSKLKMAVPKEYDLENDLIWSGKGCGWNLCSKDTLTNHEELPGEPGYIEDKTIEKITYQVNSEPPKPIILDDYLKTSQCIATYSAWNIYEDAELQQSKWIDIPSSPLKFYIKYDQNTNELNFNSLNTNDLIGNYPIAIQIQTDADVYKYKKFEVEITPDCSIEDVYDLAFK